MLPRETRDPEAGVMPTSNSSSETDQKRERIESYKDARRRELSTKYGPRHDPATKSFKATRKKEDPGRGGGTCGPFFRSYLGGQRADDRVPSRRRDGNKTEPEEPGGTPPVLVRETKASRLRAASRSLTSEAGSPSPRTLKDAKRSDKEKTPACVSPARKDVDKSHSRKSHLNRSHTSEGVYDDLCVAGGSNTRRRRSGIQSLESSPAKTPDRCISPRAAMGNANGSLRETRHVARPPLDSHWRHSSLLEKHPPKPGLMGDRGSVRKRAPEPRASPEGGPARPESLGDGSKHVDIATRAEILAASTLKMISRLDEINSKSKRSQEEASEKTLPCNSVISSGSPGESTLGVARTEAQKVPLPDDDTAKSSSARGAIKPTGTPKKAAPEGKPSILKNKPPGCAPSSGDAAKSKPVSILKRKSLSQDDAQSYSPPVTFSPSVLKKENDPKRQGILKKRRSLDENEVLRRRSHSPEAGYSDFKPILKTQRRSSMEELTRRSRSPEGTPQGILKRKSSREEETEDEPQGILKRKSLPCLGSHQHVKISDGVILAAAAGIGEIQVSESVRPILKKKSSSEEQSASEPSLAEAPKSILKKKTSLEADETEEKPKKPILKSSRMSSLEEPDDERRRSFVFGAFDAEPRPILKSRPGEAESEVVLRQVKRHERPHSSSDIDSELSAVFLKRRSLEFQPAWAAAFDAGQQRTKKASSNERLRGDPLRRPLSVAEKVTNLENFLEVERRERERRNSPPGTPPRPESPPTFQGSFDFPPSAKPSDSARSPALSSASELTLDADRASSDSRTNEESSSFATASPNRSSSLKSSDGDVVSRLEPTSSSHVRSRKSSSDTFAVLPENRNEDADHLFRRTSFHSTDSERVFPPESASKDGDTDLYFSVDSCGEKISGLTLKESSADSMDPKDSQELFLLQRSGSVSAKTSLFKELEKKSKADADEEKAKRTPRSSNAGINRRHEKKLLESNAQRYHTQPVSSEEVELAVRKKRVAGEQKCEDEGENHEDELSTMSYKDRLRLFESTFSPKFPESTPRKRGTRFKTQPVTTVEVETAKSRRASGAAAAEGGRPEEDSPGSSGLQENVSESRSPEERSRPKGILKNLSPAAAEAQGKKSDSDSSDAERGGTAGGDLSESFRNLKKALRRAEKETTLELRGILKQPSRGKKAASSGDEDPEEEAAAKSRAGARGANLAAILQRVEPVAGPERPRKKEASEGGAQGAPKYLQNPGIARIIKSRNGSSIVKSQSHSSVGTHRPEAPLALNGDRREELRSGDEVDEISLRLGGLRRSTTQPLAPPEDGADDDMSGASIRERLARLKRSGELDWQKRKSHVTNVEDELSVITAGNYLFNETCQAREKSTATDPRGGPARESDDSRSSSSILADRLGKLDAAKEGWKKRIKPSDAVKFSVEGRMLEKRESLSPPNATLQISPTRTPLAERKKRSPKAATFRSKQCNPSMNSTPSSPMERASNPIARSVSAPGGGKDGLFALSVSDDAREANGPVVTVPRNDDETFTSFFEGVSAERTFQERLEIKDEDLDVVSRMKSSQLLVQKRNVKAQRRRATVRNPVKALAARLDLQEYTETKTGIAEKELKRMKIEKAAKNSSLAVEALAGLASQEDFTAISLKKASEGGPSVPDAPYKDLMLLQVKGRRHVQTRLVEPAARNVNAGDCFVLVTPTRVFHYVGEFANVIERSRGAEISLHVQQKGDLGCTATSVVTIGQGGRATQEQIREFWALLGGEPGCEREAGDVDEDELFESALVETNMVYEVVDEELVPREAFWGAIPKIEVLDPNKILVFDFGSEFYVWNGKNAGLGKRKVALKLARELWEEGFDYTDCDLCPVTFASHVGSRDAFDDIPDADKAGPARPEWALFAKITQNMETVLFREKFLDWPDYSRVIRRSKKDGESERADPNGSPEIKPCDPKMMLENEPGVPDLVLEGSHLGRGVRYFDEETRRCSEVTTQDVTVWHVREYEYSEVPPASLGHFHTEDSYVVRWHYVITVTGRELGGQPSRHLTAGRDRYAYFFWQGSDSPVNDKGAAACLTVELDKEHGPQVRVVQGLEPPAFLNLFQGKMVVHRGRRCSEAPRERRRLFICRGDAESECVLVEVPCSMRQLRSLASFLLVCNDSGRVIVWHGGKSSENARRIALNAAERLQASTPDFGFRADRPVDVREELEGSESREFIRALGGDNRQLYYSLLEDKTEMRTPRLFHLTSVSGEFLFAEVASPYLTQERVATFPFLQSDLYSASQPALFLLDTSWGLWLWQGWWEDNAEGDRGTGHIRFQAERRAAMSTALAYWNLKHGGRTPKAFLIWAGLEPLVFTNQFPFWSDRDDVAEINMRDGRKPGEAVPVKAELDSLTKSTYPLAQLQNRPLPDGVNPTQLEDYLEAKCFPELFGIEKEEFLKMPSWKKKKLKQEAGLF